MNYNRVEYTASYGTLAQLPASKRPEVSFVGRSNVGKSSLMNKVFGRKGLVKVSSTPGKTSTINFFTEGSVDFVDLPGYGFAKVAPAERARWTELIEGYFDQDRTHALVFALVDIRHDISPLDQKMIDYLMQRDLPFVIAFTKADKLSGAQCRKQVSAICSAVKCSPDQRIVICSAVKGTGIGDIRAMISEAAQR